jgi:lysophospholipase L1-like esterase
VKKYNCSVVVLLLLFIFLSGQTVQSGVIDSLNVLDISACANWDMFKNKMLLVRRDSTITVNMLFIGDSHMQGGYSTNTIRELLRNHSFNAGRGCFFPYSIAKTNGPEDFVIKSSAAWTYSRWGQVLSIPLAGYLASTHDTAFTMTIYNKKKFPSYPFKTLTFYHSSDSISLTSDTPVDSVVHTKKADCLVESSIYFSQRTDSCTLNVTVHSTAEVFSLYLIKQKDMPENVTVNVLGMNGISFKHYNNKVDLALLPLIKPDCMVIALGTNDVFSRYADTTDLRSNITGLITKVRQLLPETALLLMTPNDHLVNKRYKNRALPLACNVIRDVAKKEKCGIWDFYTVMGGDSSVRSWRKKELIHSDYVHLTKSGYAYQGELFYNALKNAIFDSLSIDQSRISPQQPITNNSSPEPVRTGYGQPVIDSGVAVPDKAE